MTPCCAAIDFGTNTARLLIARRTTSGIEPVLVEREIVRLGGGFTDARGLSDDAWQRGLSCLRRFSSILSQHGVTQVRASATSAVRDAVNGPAFVETVLRETGIRLEVIDGELEARLTLAGTESALDEIPDSLVLLDVGGGSTEFTLSVNHAPVFIKSMPIGVVRLTEGFPSQPDMTHRVGAVLDLLEADLAGAGITIPAASVLVGTAGTATTIAAISLEMTDYDYRRVNNLVVRRDDIADMFARLSRMSAAERLSVKGLEKGREDLIIAGMIITLSVMERFGFDRLKVSDFGLLEGLALFNGE